MLENTPIPEIPQVSVRQYCQMVFVAEVATHIVYCFHSKMVKESPGSSGMLENRPTHEILKCQSALRAILAGVAAYFYCFFFKNLPIISKLQKWHL